LRWSAGENAALRRVSLLQTLSEVATQQSIAGLLPVAEAVKAAGAAHRAERELRKVMARKPAIQPAPLKLTGIFG